eukprot:SAG31_NODE_3536_length_4145_cov_51.000741_2_plen_121_part_00
MGRHSLSCGGMNVVPRRRACCLAQAVRFGGTQKVFWNSLLEAFKAHDLNKDGHLDMSGFTSLCAQVFGKHGEIDGVDSAVIKEFFDRAANFGVHDGKVRLGILIACAVEPQPSPEVACAV